jgi:CRP/FNR family cyclic AMP-dependent transcriptional regulator
MNHPGKPGAAQLDRQHRNPSGVMHMTGDIRIPDDRFVAALRNSGLVENLRDFEINLLAGLTTVQHFEDKQTIAEPGYDSLKDALMILVEGEIEVCAHVENEPVSLHLTVPGDLARIISFVGGDTLHVSARIKVRKGSSVLLLQRSRLEALLHSHPAIVYCVMRNLVRHVHGVARRKSAETEEMSNYIHSIRGRY